MTDDPDISFRDHKGKWDSITIPVKQFAIEVLLSIVATALVGHLLHLDAYHEILVGLLLFLSLAVLRRAYLIEQSLALLRMLPDHVATLADVRTFLHQLQTVHSIQRQLDSDLLRVSNNLRELIARYGGSSSLFGFWYRARLLAFLHDLEHTLETDSYTFDLSLLQEQDRLDNVFTGIETDCFCGTCTCQGVSWYLAAAGSYFLQSIDKQFTSGNIRAVRRLFIYETEADLNDPVVRVCLFLHECSGYQYRAISDASFRAVMDDFGERDFVRDFGISGKHYVWETIPKGTGAVESGVVCVNTERISKYAQLFERLWAHAAEYPIRDPEIRTLCEGHRIADLRVLRFTLGAERSNEDTQVEDIPGSEKWAKLASIWSEMEVPGIPSAEDISHFESILKSEITQGRRGRVLILGCTPELRNLLGTEQFTQHDVYCVDANIDMYREMSALSKSKNPRERFVQGDWTTFFLGERVDIILGDKVIDNIPFDLWPVFFNNMHRHLNPGGVLALHVATVGEEYAKVAFHDLLKKWAEKYESRSETLKCACSGLWDELITASWKRRQGSDRALSLLAFSDQVAGVMRNRIVVSKHEREVFDGFLPIYEATKGCVWTAYSPADIGAACYGLFETIEQFVSHDYDASKKQPIVVLRATVTDREAIKPIGDACPVPTKNVMCS